MSAFVPYIAVADPTLAPPAADLLGPTAVRGFVLVLATAVVLGGLYGWILLRRNRQLARLRRGAERFAAGELARKLPLEGPSDLVRLAEALNRMAAQLDERLRHLASQRNEMMAALSSMSEGVVAVDLEENILSLNPAAVQLLGLDPLNAIGRGIVEMIRNPALQDLTHQALQTEQTVQAEITLRAPVRSAEAAVEAPRQLLVQGTALRDAWGKRIGALLVALDVTRLRQLETVRRDFVANVSHEIKTPVAAIRGAAETLQDLAGCQNDDAQRFLRMIVRQSERLNALVEDLLNLARLEQDSQQRRVVLKPDLLAPVIEAALEACQMRAQARHIDLHVQCPTDLSAPINSGLIEQALANLLDNAIKYSPEGARVEVTAAVVGQEVVLAVQDTGPGIEPEHLTRLFERFYRVDKARSRALGGTGLGLAIVKHVAQAHGGRVSVDSAPGMGSTFRIHLPRVGAEAAAGPA